MRYLDLADLLLIGEAILGVPAERIADFPRIPLTESALAAPAASFGGQEFYPTVEEKAAVLLSRMVRNHPLPDGNKRLGWLCLREFLARNGYGLKTDVSQVVTTVERIAAGEMGEPELALWLRCRLLEL